MMLADQNIPQQYLKIMERLYIFVDTKDVDLNNRLNLVVNPEIIKILFKRVQTQNQPLSVKLQIFRKLSKIYSANRFNSLILWKRDKQIMQINHSILQSIIHYVFSFKIESRQVKEVSDLVTHFIHSYPINCKIIKNILSILIKDFYEEKTNHTILQMSIFLLRNLLKHQKRTEQEPCNYFITYGQETGIKMINRNIKWPFSKGFYFYLKFYIQDFINEDMILFNLSIEQDQFIIYITPEAVLKVKIFSTQQTLQICSLPKQKWITMSLSYIIKSKLLRNCYELICNIDGDIFERRDLPVPAISMSDEIVELTLGNRFYGKIHTVVLSRTDLLLGNKLIMNTWNQIQSFLVINKKSFREVFIFYNPILNTTLNNKEIVYDISSQNHGQMFENTGIHENPFREVDINYYGGLYTYIPLVHLLKFYDYEKYPQALTDIFELFLVFFQNKFINVQSYAINCQFFSIVCQLINEINPNFLRVDTVKVIRKINSQLTNMLLRKQMLVNFLFKINIRKVEKQNVISQLHEIICYDYFTLNFQESINLISLDDIIHYIIDNFQEEKKEMCCLHHFCHHEIDKDQVQLKSFKNNYLIKTNQITKLLKIVFTNIANSKQLRPIRTKLPQLLFYEYSSCLKLLLLQALNQGIKVNSKFFIEDLNIIPVLHTYIQKTHLPEELACLIQILLNCQEQDKTNVLMRSGNIQTIAAALDKIYSKKCEEGRFRGKTGAIKSNTMTISKKHASAEKNEVKMDRSSKDITKKSWTMKQKNSPIESNRSLYEAVIKMCFEFNLREQTWLLKNDEFCQILQPYFRICCLDYRRNIINMIRCTVFSAIEGKKFNSQSNQFNRLYKLLLTEFILKQLQPEGNELIPSNDIMLNFYFIIDYTVISMREDWLHLYMYLLRLSGIMEEAKKEIALKYLKSPEDLSLATKISNRKFVLRVVKSAQKNIYNFSNCIFLIFILLLTIQNPNTHYNLFQYFKSYQKFLFIGRAGTSEMKNKIKFLDSTLIIQTVNSFKLWKADQSNVAPIDLLKYDWKQKQKIINAYLDLQYTKQTSQLYKNRFMYLIKAEFKPPRNNQHPLKDLFMGSQHRKVISTGQIVGTLLCLCVQISLSTSDIELFKESINSLNNFIYWFLLLSSRDGLKLQKHSQRNMQLPKSIIYNVLHFLYFLLNSKYEKTYIQVIQDTIYGIFSFLGLIIRCLSQKVGNSQSIEKVLQKAAVMKNLEQYNFFTFELFKTVLALKDLKIIPDISKQKVLKVIHHPKVSNFFKNDLTISIQSKIEELSKEHQKTQTQVKKRIQQFFSKEKNVNITNDVSFSQEEFKKNFVFQHVKTNNLEYRKTQRIWMKIWKRLRLYHYFWSISMNQREQMQLQFIKNARLPYRHKLSKFVDANGARPVLEVEHIQPWHVKKVLMEKEYEYRNSNYLLNLHQQIQTKRKQKSFIQKLIKPQEESAKFYVNWIKHNSKRKGYISIENQKIKFQYESTFQKDSHLEFSSFILAEHKPVEKYWPLVQITNIYQRRYLTKRQCLLIQFQEGTSLIFNFINEDKDDFMRLILAKQNKTDKTVLMKLNKISFYTKRFDLQCIEAIQEANSLWKSHKISNFQYLLLINKYAGRTYLDPANYPVFPWIIATYDYQRYKYRDLSKSVGALGNQQRINFYHNKLQANDPFDPVPPYQFGTHYSSPGTVFGFLIRLQPYTEASRTLQGGKFDLPDRLFSSVKVCWHSVTTQVSDVRQLTPEFYYLPQFLLNIEHHDFGLTQQKERVHNVQLPAWAKNAYQFIVTQRKELESDYVSENIGNWIDLIFGYKQKGKIAEQNLNLFYYLTYEGAIDLKQIKDDQTRISNQAQIMHFGQTPSQIFTKPHGGRPKSKKLGFGLKKITLLLSLQNTGPMTILGITENKLYLFHDYTLLICQQHITYSVQKQIRLLRNNSKENIYFLQDIQFYKRVQIFNNQKYIAIASYINGDLLIFSLNDGKKVQEKKGTAKLCLHINEKEDLLLVGSRNGLLQVYQIVYGQKQTLTLIKIAAEYYMAPIYSISQGGRFFCISSGSMVTLIRASRALNYVYDKSKMRGVKMIRSIEVSKKIQRCIISTDPLFCFIICTELEIYCYSGNGQLLASKQVALTFPPVKFTQNFMDYLAYLENNRLKIVSLPFFSDIRDLQLPNKIYVQIKIFENRCFLVTNLGQIITLYQQPQQNQ